MTEAGSFNLSTPMFARLMKFRVSIRWLRCLRLTLFPASVPAPSPHPGPQGLVFSRTGYRDRDKSPDPRWRGITRTLLVSLALIQSAAGQTGNPNSNPTNKLPAEVEADLQDGAPSLPEKKLFNGQSLEGWKIASFGGEGEVLVEDGLLILEAGFPLTGITSSLTDLPRTHYELEVIARKTAGIDFLIGLTFPIEDSYATLIVGGWAGPVVGISMIDGNDASRNETRKLMKFELNRWYRIRLRVVPEKIQAWIDDELVVDLLTSGKTFSVRNETLANRPLGICNFETRTEIKSILLRQIPQATESSPIKDRESTFLEKNPSSIPDR
jgi:hypothetical protein